METHDQTIAAIAVGNPNFSILVRALQAADLVGAVADDSADLTVFAPTNDAFIALASRLGFSGDTTDDEAVFGAIAGALTGLSSDGDPIPLLSDILLYHVSSGSKPLSSVTSADSTSTLQGTALIGAADSLIDNDPDAPNPAFISGLTDIAASNGTIHAIDGVLLPLDVPGVASDATLADIVVGASSLDGFDDNAGDFDILLAALTAADLVGAVADPNANLTVFAPTDGAFISLAETLGGSHGTEGEAFNTIVGGLTELSSDGNPIPLLTSVLTYHVLDDSLGRVELIDASVNPLFDADLNPGAQTIVDLDPGVADAAFIDAASDLVASNGIAHAIDRVLLPLDLPEAQSSGGSGDDRLEIGSSVTSIDGGDGHDTAVFATSRSAFTATPTDGGFRLDTGTQTIDITNVEVFEFSDGSVVVDTSEAAASVSRLYAAGFGRDADIDGLTFWTDVEDQIGFNAVADSFVTSDEFASIYGPNPTHATYINGLYENVLDRGADAAGLDFWAGVLDSGTVDVGDMLAFFAESPENVERTLNATDDGLLLFA